MKKNAFAHQILAETPVEVSQFLRRYWEITIRIQELLDEKGWSQRDLAQKMGKTPAEINKWLRGDHNFTLQTLCKIEVELNQDIFEFSRVSKEAHKRKVFKGKVSFQNPENYPVFNKQTPVIHLQGTVEKTRYLSVSA